jgi:hypothetical protein
VVNAESVAVFSGGGTSQLASVADGDCHSLPGVDQRSMLVRGTPVSSIAR